MYEIRTKVECIDARGKWKTFDHNFDNVAVSMVTLFIIASLEGWPDIMVQAVDATEIEMGP